MSVFCSTTSIVPTRRWEIEIEYQVSCVLMDTKNAFKALFKAVRLGPHVAPPPGETLDRVDTLVLAVCVYVQGLGYDIVASGSKAEAYFAEQQGDEVQPYSCATADHGMQGWRDLRGSGVYAFVACAEFGGMRDQTCVRCIVVGEDRVVVHCSRVAWDAQGTQVSLQDDRVAQSLLGHTSCSYKDMAVLDLESHVYVDDDGSLSDVDGFLSVMQQALCERPKPSGPSITQPIHADDTPTTATEIGSVKRDTRVGYEDVGPYQGERRGGHDGGMLVGPHHPIFGPGRLDPTRPEQQGTLPPGARWDPIAPPGVRGFFPGDFQRRQPPSTQPHPDVMPRGDPSDGPEYM